MKNNELAYLLLRTKRKSISIQIDPDGKIIVRAPLKFPSEKIAQWISSKQQWIDRSLCRIEQNRFLSIPDSLDQLFQINILGQCCSFSICECARIMLDRQCQTIFFPLRYRGSRERSRLTAWLKKEAYSFLVQRAEDLSKSICQTPRAITIGSARKQWGSCNARGEIRLSWYLYMLPPTLIDYVILHELVHLKVFSHSRSFWDELTKWLPEARSLRKELKQYVIT